MATLQKEKRILLGTCLLIIYLLYPCLLPAQFSFEEGNDPIVNFAKSGVAVAVTDINGDGLDDVVRFNNAEQLQILLQLPSGSFKLHFQAEITLRLQWNILVYDLNQDGWADIISSGQDEINYWISTSTGDYQHLRDGRYSIFSQAANLVDFEKDGKADVFICNDVGENLMLEGASQIPFNSRDYLYFELTDPEAYAGNYGSVWQDVNGDGREDLYISKCFQTATQPSDPRRINQLFLSEGDTAFVESAVDWGVADSAQSWASTFADVDNDGDWDLLVLNHDAASALYYNQGDHFTKSIDFAGSPLEITSVQLIANDFNCDGWIDFIITGRETVYLLNKGDGTFIRRNDVFGKYRNDISTAASGDLNNDGYMDLFIARHNLYNSPSLKEDRILINSGGNDHYIRFQWVDSTHSLAGLNGVCKIYTKQGLQMRSMRVGDAYGITNSNMLHFGIGNEERVDSVCFLWADGHTDVFYDLPADQSFYVQKGRGIFTSRQNTLTISYLCAGDTAILSIPDSVLDPVIYHYESGDYFNSRNLVVRNEGNYYWKGRTNNGLFVRSNPVYIPFDPVPSKDIGHEGKLNLCHNDTIRLNVDPGIHLMWNDGLMDPGRIIDTAGLYFATLQGKCGQYISDSVQVDFYPDIPFEVFGDTIVSGDDALLAASTPMTAWYLNEGGSEPFYFGRELTLDNVQRDTDFWAEAFETHEFQEINSLGPVRHEGENKYHGPFMDEALEFDVLNACKLLSVTVETEIPGIRGIQLIHNRKLLRVDTFFIDSGKTVLELNWHLEAGSNYVIKTDRGINFALNNIYSPQLFRTTGQRVSGEPLIDYPYSEGQVIQITGSSTGHKDYYYFYNWKVKEAPDTCYSERKKVSVKVDGSSSVNYASDRRLGIYPNPAYNSFTIIDKGTETEGTLWLYSSHGHLLKSWSGIIHNQSFDISDLPPAWYQLVWKSNDEFRVGAVLKME